VNDFFVWLGVDGWRPVLTALVMPPVPFIVLSLLGARLMLRRRALAWTLALLGALGTWLMCTGVAADGLRHLLLPPVRALTPAEVNDLRRAPRAAIVVLGGGSRRLAPEYGVSDLSPLSLDRLRYGLHLSRQTNLPVMYSGGRGHGAEPDSATEAETAARVAARDFGRPLRWEESESRDTRENALRSVALLRREGVEHIVLVTHAYHMPRARDNFERAIATSGTRLRLTLAPMGLIPRDPLQLADFLPSRTGFFETRLVLHEALGRLLGA
jgi:uncharacterized SAM-binding protein YcdF (DUF218 family)